jgi:glycosyltransferase involved in cell wall biosynthesis
LTHNRAAYFKGTIASLNETISIDKKKLYVFDDGSTEPEHEEIIERLKKDIIVVEFGRCHKPFKATKKAIEYMYVNNPKDNEIILCQDDIRFSKQWYFNAICAIEAMYKAGLDWGILSLYNLRTPSIKPYTVIESGHAGGPCMIISRAMWTEYRKDNTIDDGRECNLADFLIAHWCQTYEPRQFAVAVTGRSFVQHIGIHSTLSDKDMTKCISPYFED